MIFIFYLEKLCKNVLTSLLSIISPDLNPNNAYVLLIGYQIIKEKMRWKENIVFKAIRTRINSVI